MQKLLHILGVISCAFVGMGSMTVAEAGPKIAFSSDRDGSNGDIYVMDADGSNQTNLTMTISSQDSFPAWSPDGTKIAFHSFGAGNYDIYV
ncbi:MAG: translocation protein TolB, partial [Myxococcota bacterium]